MFPESQNSPTRLLECGIGIAVSSDIRVNLLSPPCGVGFGPCAVSRTPVPEAAVDEHSDPSAWEHKIDPTSRSEDRSINVEAQPQPMNCSAHRQLARRIASRRDLHPVPDGRRGRLGSLCLLLFAPGFVRAQRRSRRSFDGS